MIDAVVKVGGSLGRGACLAELGARLVELGRTKRLLVVPGGGAFADVVREYDARFGLRPSTAHWMAVLAMDQYGHLLADLVPGCALVRTLGEARAWLAHEGVSVLLPSEPLRHADTLPHSWSVTSDSIAAWLTGQVGAGLLVLLKDRHGMASFAATPASAPASAITVAEMASSSGVDGHLAELLADAAFDLWILDGERPERLTELLEAGKTEGVRLARPGL
ncbi:MAG TPA: amino acid kinase [Thermoleophilia bacterium]